MNRFSVALYIGVLLAGAWIVAPAVGQSEDAAAKIRAALNIDDAKKRQEAIENVIKKMTSVSQLHQLYFTKDDELAQVQQDIGKQLAAVIESGTRDPSEERQTALAVLIASLADKASLDEPAGQLAPEKGPKILFRRDLVNAAIILTKSKHTTTRQAAFHAIGKLTPAPTDAIFEPLQNALKSDKVGPRRLAAYALVDLARNARHFNDADEIAKTLDHVIRTATVGLKDKDEPVLGYSLQAIHEAATLLGERFSLPLRPDMTAKVKEELRDEFRKLVKVFPSALKALQVSNGRLLDAVHDERPKVRVTCVLALVQIGDLRAKIIRSIDKLQLDADQKAKFKAADPLAEILAKLDRVAPLLQDEDIRLRRGSMEFFELLGDQAEPVLADVTHALRDQDRFVRLSAARAFRNLSAAKVSGQAIRTLGALVTDPDADICRAAAEALEALGPSASGKQAPVGDFQKAVHYLGLITGKQYVDNRPPDTESRVAAMKALVAIGMRTKTEPLAELAIPSVMAALFDEEVRVRRAAAETLGRLGRPGDSDLAKLENEALQRALRDEDAEVRLSAASAIVDIVPSKKPL